MEWDVDQWKSGPNEFIRIRQLYLDPRLDITFAYNLGICRQPFLLLFTSSCPALSSLARYKTNPFQCGLAAAAESLRKRVSQLNTLLLPPSHIIPFITRQGVPPINSEWGSIITFKFNSDFLFVREDMAGSSSAVVIHAQILQISM